jgi:hypothetical protein
MVVSYRECSFSDTRSAIRVEPQILLWRDAG